jgi:hypothetical protein
MNENESQEPILRPGSANPERERHHQIWSIAFSTLLIFFLGAVTVVTLLVFLLLTLFVGVVGLTEGQKKMLERLDRLEQSAGTVPEGGATRAAD